MGLKAPNAFGLHDMLGNVWEWVQDRYEHFYPGGTVTDPVRSGQPHEWYETRGYRGKVNGGGSWNCAFADCRDVSAPYRNYSTENGWSHKELGLPIARTQ